MPASRKTHLSEFLIRPDTFWQLIETLLIHKTRDEQLRRRHQASLSALCRGHALPRLPRGQSAKKTAHGSAKLKIAQNLEVHLPKCKSNYSNEVEDAPQLGDRVQGDNEEPKSFSLNEAPQLSRAKEAKSESRLSENDVVYVKKVKGASVPASERLWRYAIKNRKKEYCMLQTAPSDDTSVGPKPDMRSNEAIYNELRKRSDERKEEKKAGHEPHEHAQERPNRQRHSCGHIQQILNEMQSQKQLDAQMRQTKQVTETPNHQPCPKPGLKLQSSSTPDRKVSQTSTSEPKKPVSMAAVQKVPKNASQELKTHQPATTVPKQHLFPQCEFVINKPAMSTTITPTTPTMQLGISKQDGGVSRCQSSQNSQVWMLEPAKEEDAWEDLARQPSCKCKEKFESKQVLAQYSSVFKRRLSCGNQLDVINKQMGSRKCGASARSVLSKDTRRRYRELKAEYLSLCKRESKLRKQITLLNAEIFMMQNKGFHKTPATIKTITLDSSPLRRSQTNQQPAAVTSSPHMTADGHVTKEGALPVFPRLRAPRPLITGVQSKLHLDKPTEKVDLKLSTPENDRRVEEPEVELKERVRLPSVTSPCSPVHAVCSIYSISPYLISQPICREPFPIPDRTPVKLAHRLPRLASAESLTRRPYSLHG